MQTSNTPEMVTIPAAEYRDLQAATVTIPLSEYHALKRMAENTKTVVILPNPGKNGRYQSKFYHDKEMRDFVAERLGREKIKDIAAQCHKIFGAKRAPSQSAISRFWIAETSAGRAVKRDYLKPLQERV